MEGSLYFNNKCSSLYKRLLVRVNEYKSLKQWKFHRVQNAILLKCHVIIMGELGNVWAYLTYALKEH